MIPLFTYCEYLLIQIAKRNAILETIKWSGNAAFYIGAILVSISATLSQQAWVFIFFLIGHILWAFSGLIMQDKAIVWQGLFFIPIDTYAILTRI